MLHGYAPLISQLQQHGQQVILGMLSIQERQQTPVELIQPDALMTQVDHLSPAGLRLQTGQVGGLRPGARLQRELGRLYVKFE